MQNEELQNWLSTMLPLEKDCKKWLETHQNPMPEVIFRKRLAEEARQILSHPSPFDAINPSHLPVQALYFGRICIADVNSLFTRDQDFIICKHPRYMPENWHKYNFSEVVYVLKGSCTQSFRHDAKIENIQLEEGDFCLISPNTECTKSVFDESIIVNILVHGNILRRALSTLLDDSPLLTYFFHFLDSNQSHGYLLFSTGQDAYIKNTIYEMMKEVCENNLYNQKSLFLLLGLLLLHLQRDYLVTLRFSDYSPQATNYMPLFFKYLEDEYAHFSLKDMSSHFHLSATYICHIVKKNTGRTLLSYLTDIRINIAKQLLKKTTTPVSDIGNAVGYKDCTHFIRTFKRHIGCTPSQYRRLPPDAL